MAADILKRPDVSSNPEDRRLVPFVLGEWMLKMGSARIGHQMSLVGMATTLDRAERTIVRVADPRGRSGSLTVKPIESDEGRRVALGKRHATPRCPLSNKMALNDPPMRPSNRRHRGEHVATCAQAIFGAPGMREHSRARRYQPQGEDQAPVLAAPA